MGYPGSEDMNRIPKDDDVDEGSIRKRLLFQTLCWYIWYFSGRYHSLAERGYWSNVFDSWLNEHWNDFLRDGEK